MFLAVQLLALAVACLIFGVLLFLQRRVRRTKAPQPIPSPAVLFQPIAPLRPTTWVAVRAATPAAVQNALGLNRSAPCSWLEGMAGEHEFFISQRIHGWVIITGAGLPGPEDDVDACFHFLITLSRKLGHVQFFHAEAISHHHAWARLDDGYVTRAYAWAGKTVWNQGVKTAAEIEFKMKCFGYGDESFSEKVVEMNRDKVPLLATRWSLDPARVRLLKKMDGIAGQSSQVF